MGKIKIKRLTVDIAYDPEGLEDEGRIVGDLKQVIDQSVPNRIGTKIVNVKDIYDSDNVEVKTPFTPAEQINCPILTTSLIDTFIQRCLEADTTEISDNYR